VSAAAATPAGATANGGQPGRYRVEAGLALAPFLARCAALADGAALPFHSQAWLHAWYATLGAADGRQPLLLALCHADSGRDAALLPLVRQRRGGLWVVQFADAGLVDYIAPLLAAHWHGGQPPAQAARALWQALRQGLRGNHLLQLHKLLPQLLDETGAGPNPLALALPTQACEMFGNQFSVAGGDWDAWRHTLDKRVRKEIERCWRVFQRSPQARFEQVRDLPRALALFDVLDQQQSERLQALGVPHALDAPACRAFYRQALAQGLASGEVVLTALLDGPHVVSAMLGVANGQRYIALRQSLGGDAWMHCSPGRLLDEATARHLHASGLRFFDFGIGDYHHKAALRMAPIPLRDACVALHWRGWPAALAWRLRRALKRQAALRALVRRLRRRGRLGPAARQSGTSHAP